MKKLLLVVFATFAFSCSHPGRGPNSEGFELRPPVMHPDQAAAQKMVEELKNFRYAAQFHLNRFDQAISKMSGEEDILSLPGYYELLELRGRIESRRHKIVAAYKKARQKNNQLELSGFQAAFRDLQEDPADKVLMNDLLIDLTKSFDGSSLPETERSLLQPYQNDDLFQTAEVERDSIAYNLDTMMKSEGFQDLVNSVQKKESREPQSSARVVNGSGFSSGVWALTFDDGPSGKYSPQVFQNLRATGMGATFFWLAQNVSSNPGIVKQAGGFELANHSYTHAQLTKLGSAGLNREIVQSTAVETKIYGHRPTYFRPPYGAGANNGRIRSMVAGQGMTIVLWNVDSLDWQDHSPASILSRVKRQMAARGKGIILFHDIHPQSVAASKLLMQERKSQGKRFVSVGAAD